MRRKLQIISLAIAFVSINGLTNCASIIHGPTQVVDFSSQPTGASVTIDGKEYGNTPQSITLRRMGRSKDEAKPKQEYQVKIAMEGYYPYEVKIKREMDGWFLGNILFGGIIGIIIDAANGSMYKLTPDQVIAQMGKSTAMNRSDDSNLVISVALEIDPSWEKIGQLKKVD
ncbi:MAG: hypothetical protein Tsb0034_12840 [Ekhidna sp.]